MTRYLIAVLVLAAACPIALLAEDQAATGRYVHVTIPGRRRTLSLAEVQVFSDGRNVALKRPALQTTTAHGGEAQRAVDGNTSGVWGDNSTTHTSGHDDPAWEVDLGKAVAIGKIVIWNRSGGAASRLNGVQVSVLDEQRKVVWGAKIAEPGEKTELAVAGSKACPWAGTVIAKVVAQAPTARGRDRQPKGKSRQPAKKPRKPKKRRDTGPSTPLSTGTPASLRLAIQDLMKTFGPEYPKGAEYLRRLAALEAKMTDGQGAEEFKALQQEALLANPLLRFDKLLVVKRKGHNGLVNNWLGNCSLPRGKSDDEIAVLSPVSPEGKLTTLYKPAGKDFVGDVDLRWDAKKLLFSMVGSKGRWQVFEIGTDGKGLRQVSRGDDDDVDNYDPCYLPDGRIIFSSTANYHAVPCIGGKQPVGNLYSMDADGGNVRQLCFEQDHDWYPVVLPNGRVMYSRWEYTDTPHYFTRLVMTMNPDGSNQEAHYGSNSYWPNSLFYPRPFPGSSTKFAGIVSGHHGTARAGELVLFDIAKGRHEASGVIQRIPGYGKPVPATIADRLVSNIWPKFLHPWPLSEKYHLVCVQPNGRTKWGVYLVDVFDNFVPICVLPDAMVFEPVPLRPRPKPPVLAPRVNTERKDAVVFLLDVYRGPGLAGLPRGKVKKLRVLSYHFAYNRSGGHSSVGQESGWDIKRILGTVPVETDGSALFRVPANTPLALQPLDEKGRALQLMRSWFVAMPGEVISCVGCHEPMNDSPPPPLRLATRRDVSEITPWRGPARPFSFTTEVRPVLDKYCVGCHDGSVPTRPDFSKSNPTSYAKDIAYNALHPYVRRPGSESDVHVFQPMEYHVSTSELFQMLEKGHHNVKLDAEAWDRLTVWTDFNVPHRGQWSPPQFDGHDQSKRRKELARLYANLDCDPESEFQQALAAAAQRKVKFIKPQPVPDTPVARPKVPGWPFDAAAAKAKQQALGETALSVELAEGVKMNLVLVPAGEFVMGDPAGCADEKPLSRVKIDKPFWMGVCEVTNQQYAAFDPDHDSRFFDQQWKDHATPGYPANKPDQPVIRISYEQARAFCRWLSHKTGQQFALPTEAQWEWACRAGSDQAMSYGSVEADFGKLANLADNTTRLLAVKGVNPKPVKNPPAAMAFLPKITSVDDGQLVTAPVGSYQPNAWGLKDMHGNVAEWTRTTYRPYPYDPADGRDDPVPSAKRHALHNPIRKVVRGGSWRDRPKRARCAFRLAYLPYQRVFNVGFRVLCTGPATKVATSK